MPDKIEKFRNSLIQHGKENDRVYLMKLADEDMPGLVISLIRYAAVAGYGKIFAKVPSRHREAFLRAGFRLEGEIPGFYRGEKDAAFLGYYHDASRREESRPEMVREVLELAERKACQEEPVPLPKELTCRVAGPEDTESMADLYREVFASYPFPIHDPAYLCQTMEENLVYFGVWEGDSLIALSSAEMDVAAGNAEMTDFATLPACRGRGIAQHLLQEMEEEMARRNIRSLYTIARAYSHGMNITFA
ncbi:MAG: putative beta-lysine N-acetyltransferase, partial [Desulfuromonas sp.]